MTRHDIATLSLRLAALYAWLAALEHVASGTLAASFVTASTIGALRSIVVLGHLSPAIIFGVIGTALFARAPQLAFHFLPPATEPTQTESGRAVPPTLAFGVVGLVGAIYSFPRIAQRIISLLQSDQFRAPTTKDALLLQLPSIAASFMQFALCLAIVIYARRFAMWWERRQNSHPNEVA
jgi:hypothetical protein